MKIIYENDRKNKADHLKCKFKKVGIFDQKIIEVAISSAYIIRAIYE